MLFRLKHWIGERPGVIAGAITILALILYAVAYIIERGFTGLTPGTLIASVATALLLASISVTIEQYIKAKLTDREINTIITIRDLGIEQIQERNVSRGLFSGLPTGILNACHHEVVVLAYAADNFIERNRPWIAESLDEGIRVGLILLHPDTLEQAEQTEGRNITAHIQKTLAYCNQLIFENPERAKQLYVKGYTEHIYFSGVFIDRTIICSDTKHTKLGLVSIQLKANFKSQHQGIVLTFSPESRYCDFYCKSCSEIWKRSCDLLVVHNQGGSITAINK